MPMYPAVADLSDAHPDAAVCLPLFREFGGREAFAGPVQTLKVFEDNALVREQLQQPGQGRVLVVDGVGSLRCALLGGDLGQLAVDHGWAGLVINGAVRDCAELCLLALGVRALASCPRKSNKGLHGGATGIKVSFAGVQFCPGDWLYADRDGMLLSPVPLHGTQA